MTRTVNVFFALMIGFAAAGSAAFAAPRQQMVQSDTDQQTQPVPDDRLLRGNNIAPTGKTLPHPGASQIGPESEQEKGAQHRSDKDTKSICTNCE